MAKVLELSQNLSMIKKWLALVFAGSKEMIMINQNLSLMLYPPLNIKLLSPTRAMEKTSSNLGYLAGQIYVLMEFKLTEIGDKFMT